MKYQKLLFYGSNGIAFIFALILTVSFSISAQTTPGTLDTSFVNPNISTTTYAMMIQRDGKIVIGGGFLSVGSQARNFLARLNNDGTLDASFAPNINGSVFAIAIQPDGKILIGGSFTTVGAEARKWVARLNVDGTLDASFTNPNVGGISFARVHTLKLQPDGKVLIGGNFNSVGGQARFLHARLNSDGTLDTSYNPNFGSGNLVNVMAIQPDGKVLIGGNFNLAGAAGGQYLARLNSDGSHDNSFNAQVPPNDGIFAIAIQSDGKIIFSGGFMNIGTQPMRYLARVNSDGSLDTSFNSNVGSFRIYSIAIQSDGKILIGGDFPSVSNQPRKNVARLNSDGNLDTTFVDSDPDRVVLQLTLQQNGRILIAGDFSSISGQPRSGMARLNNTSPRLAQFDFDGDGKSEISVFRPSNGFWYRFNSSNNSFFAIQFGQSTDKPAPADYDGDGKTDIAVFREGAFGYFYILNSSDNTFRFAQFGTTGDLPVPGDWDGDGVADLAVYRGNNTIGSQSNFYYRPSGTSGVDYRTIVNGAGGRPVVGDFDGDGRVDAALFLPSAVWSIRRSSDNQYTDVSFGVQSDIPVAADFDGDGKTNIAVFRPSNGTWYTSQNPSTNYGAIVFGANGDLPVPADYDGDGRADAAVFRPSNGAWYLNRSTLGFMGVAFGQSGDKPIPNAFVH